MADHGIPPPLNDPNFPHRLPNFDPFDVTLTLRSAVDPTTLLISLTQHFKLWHISTRSATLAPTGYKITESFGVFPASLLTFLQPTAILTAD
jgi:hypothetical protein